MDKDTVIVGALMLIAAAAIVMVTLDVDSDALEIDEYPARLTVLGNVNGDDHIDETDLALLQSKVDQVITYERDYMYDVNFDGQINANDVHQLEQMLQAMETGDWSLCPTVYYVDVDHSVRSYDMTANNNVVTLIVPPLDMVLALDPDLVVGTDFRPQPSGSGLYWPQFMTLLDWDNIVDVGDPYTPNKEAIMSLATEYGGISVVCGSKGTFATDLEEKASGAGVQVIRIPTWEYGYSIHGFLTLGFLLDRLDEAYAYVEWYDALDAYILDSLSTVQEEDYKKVAAVYTYRDPMTLLGPSSAEYANVLKLGVTDDITSAYLHGQTTGGHGNTVSQETIIELIQNYGMELLVGHQGLPFQMGSAGDPGTYATIKGNYDKWYAYLGTALEMNDCDFIIIGYTFSSGIPDILNRLILAWYMFPECFGNGSAEEIVKPYIDQYCEMIHISEDANGYEGWGFDRMNLLYAGQNNPRNIMNGV